MMLQRYWDKHPGHREIVQVLREGQWVSHVFEWIFMMISRFTGYAMTLAIGYIIYYAIEFKHSLDAVIAHPGFADNLASMSNVIINVGPELVFPGVVVLCIRGFQARRWLDGTLYLVTTIAFVILTMVLLNAFMSNQITSDFLNAMLFWRAGASLFYTVVAAYAGGHGGLDFRELLAELDTLRTQLDGGQQRVATLEQQLSSVQQRASSLQQQLDSAKQETSILRDELETEKRRIIALQLELETRHGDAAGLHRELNAAQIEAETLHMQLDGKQQELASMRKSMENGQQWQLSRISTLQQELEAEQAAAITLRRQLNAAQLDIETLRAQLDGKQREIEGVQSALRNEQQMVSSLRRELSGGQGKSVDSGQEKIVHLDTNRSRKTGQDESALGNQIKALLQNEPDLSGRAIAARLGCSPTTAAKWKSLLEHGDQAMNE